MSKVTQHLALGHAILFCSWIILASPIPPWSDGNFSLWMFLILLGIHIVIYRIQARPWHDLRLGIRSSLGAIPSNREELRSLKDHWLELEKQHREAIQVLTQEKDQLEGLVHSMKDGLVTIDNKGCITSLNSSAQKILNLNGPSVFGESLSKLLRSSQFELFERDLTLHHKPFDTELTLYQGTLQERIFQARGSLFNDLRDDRHGLIVFSDVTELRRLESMRRDFVANVSHELKTPLTSVKGYAETLLDMEGIEETPKRFLGKISHNAERLHQIIEDLLVLSRIEQHGLNREQMERMTFHTIFEGLRNEETQNSSPIISFHSDNENKFLLHGPLIHLALFNLIDNAKKYSKADQIFVRGKSNAEHGFTFIVEDQGVGIPKEHLPNIMNRFYRIDKARSRENGGTGLGLSIVKLIVEAHGGDVDVKSELGQGTAFHLNFPAQLIAEDTKPLQVANSE